MLFFTIAMIVWWALSVFSAEVFRLSDTKKNKGEIEDKDLVGAGCLYITFALTYALGELIYLLFALKHDTYLYPTYSMLGLYIIDFLVAMFMILFSRITGKKREVKEKTGFYSYFTRFITMVYFGYMLWVVIS
ncbi:hypothetical protein ABNX05_10855 [Lysinibacillus sp. M3]|uniref:Uncharacterized protein n=1 Tax=Lysinibacillus zambalensis TaxID=3160866 RepID=A0ABV1MRH2_9BACI